MSPGRGRRLPPSRLALWRACPRRRVPVHADARHATPGTIRARGQWRLGRAPSEPAPSGLRSDARSLTSPILLSFADHGRRQADEEGDQRFQARLREERGELQTQLATIEDHTFATTQSELSGDVGVDDESADAGTATFEREKELSIEQNVRDLLHKIDRALKRIDDGTYGICERCGKSDREGSDQGAAVRRSVHQGRTGAVAPIARGPRAAGAAATLLFALAGLAYLLDRVTKLWAERTPRRTRPRDVIPGRAHAAVHDQHRAARSASATAPRWLFAGAAIVVSSRSSPPRSAHRHTLHAVALGLILGGALGNLIDRVVRGSGLHGRVVDFIDSTSVAHLQPRRLRDRRGRGAAGGRLDASGRGQRGRR